MNIKIGCEYCDQEEIRRAPRHGTFDDPNPIYNYWCRHPKSKRPNLTSSDGMCDISNDYCPYNPTHTSEPSE